MEIRKYLESDRERLRYICRQTAWDSYKKSKRRLETVPVMFNDYFTEYEPENIFVLSDGGKAVGYIICSVDYGRFTKFMLGECKKRVLKLDPSRIFFVNKYIRNFKCIKDKPVHFHIDILPQYQKNGWGTKLMNTLCKHLREKGINHLSVCSVSRASAGYKVYRKQGFEEIWDYGKNIVSLSKKL